MKSLYEKLNPEVKQRLIDESEKYNLVNTSIFPMLKEKHFYSDLTMGEISRIITFSNTETHRWSFWDLRYGDILFNNEK